MRKLLFMCLFSTFYLSSANAEEPLLPKIVNMTNEEIAKKGESIRDFKNRVAEEIEAAIGGKFPIKLSNRVYTTLSQISVDCSRQDKRYLTDEICAMNFANYIGGIIENEHKRFKSMSLKEYENMTIGEFSQISDFNNQEFLELIRPHYGNQVVHQMHQLSEKMAVCQNEKTKSYLFPKQKKELDKACNVKIKTILADF